MSSLDLFLPYYPIRQPGRPPRGFKRPRQEQRPGLEIQRPIGHQPTITELMKRRRLNKKTQNQIGFYTGRYKIPKHGIKPNTYAINGCRGEGERVGTVTDPNVAYVGVSSYTRLKRFDSVVYQMAGAIMRKILKREMGVDLTSWDQIVGEDSSRATDSYKGPVSGIRILYMDYSGAAPITGLAGAIIVGNKTSTVPLKSFKTIVDEMYDFMTNQVYVGRNKMIYGYQLEYCFDGGATFNTGPVRRLDIMKCKAYSYVDITVQNASSADDSATGDALATDRVDANPIEGRVISFNSIMPRIKANFQQALYTGTSTATVDTSYRLMNDTNGDGVIKPDITSATMSGASGGWVQIPTDDMFDKISGSKSLKLAPGEIRRTSLKFVFDGFLKDFIAGTCRTMQGTTYAAAVANDRIIGKDQFGSSILFAFEKLMSTGTGSVKLNFEVNFKSGAVLTKSKALTLPPSTTAAAVVADDTA